ncbi:MAG: hypothetical protein IT472_10640 [Thermomonas sp.]|uniref:hypothetical protein n=1 Tax=Thermomonas sp. TaxID=1971895 RepID=UPI0026353813|nr:hypothetical protein [Thermomonas sp.]MCC7097625.1 hypothetical protein [Thermomonas sp.]
MSDDGGLFMLLLGPAGGAGFYWAMYRYYRNTDKSHSFEHETAVESKLVEGEEKDIKIDEITGTRDKRIKGDNVSEYRRRVTRIPNDPSG